MSAFVNIKYTTELATGVQAGANAARRSGSKRYYIYAAHATHEVEGNRMIE